MQYVACFGKKRLCTKSRWALCQGLYNMGDYFSFHISGITSRKISRTSRSIYKHTNFIYWKYCGMPGPPCLSVFVYALFHAFHSCDLEKSYMSVLGRIYYKGWFVQSATADSGFAGDPTSLARYNIYIAFLHNLFKIECISLMIIGIKGSWSRIRKIMK